MYYSILLLFCKISQVVDRICSTFFSTICKCIWLVRIYDFTPFRPSVGVSVCHLFSIFWLPYFIWFAQILFLGSRGSFTNWPMGTFLRVCVRVWHIFPGNCSNDFLEIWHEVWNPEILKSLRNRLKKSPSPFGLKMRKFGKNSTFCNLWENGSNNF